MGMPFYPLTEHNAYWAGVMKADMAKGKTPQQVCHETHLAILMMGRGPKEAMNVTQQAAYWAGINGSMIKW